MRKKSSVEEKLEALSQGEERSQIGQLRDILGSVEKAFAAGSNRAQVLKTLQSEGFTLTLRGFDNALYLLRKERAAQGHLAPVGTNPTPPRANPQLIAQQSPKPSAVAPPSTQKPHESKVTDKDREEYEAFMESIKHLPEKEQRKKHAQYLVARRSRL
jgi:hypothetical protein